MIDLYLAPGCTQSAKDKVHVRLMDDIIYIYISRIARVRTYDGVSVFQVV